MATIDIKLSQKTINQLHQIDSGESTNLSDVFSQIVETNSEISNNFNWASSWSSSGNKVTLKFGTTATLTYTGNIYPDYHDSYTGIAVANSRIINAPGYFKESITGTLNYDYYASHSYLSYSPRGTATINSYKLESYQPDTNLGKTSYSLSGNIYINSSNGLISGSLSNLAVTASKVGTIAIDGAFIVSSNTNTPSQSSVTGTLTKYKETYSDKSYVNVIGNLSLQDSTVLDESLLANATYWSDDDNISLILPGSLYSDYTMNAGSGNDLITAAGGGGRLFINAGTGNDEITVNDASPSIDGGDDNDTIKSSSISLSLANYRNIENITLLGTKSLNATGNGEANAITGNSAVNVLDGGGASTGLGDTLIGGAGNDTFVVYSSDDSISDSAGTDLVTSHVNWELASGFENLTLLGKNPTQGTGNSANNTITGNSSGNLLMGMDGVDTLYGLGGDDTLEGGSGADKLIGGLDNDTYVIDNKSDTITEKTNEGTDTVQTALASFSLAKLPAIENLTYTGSGNASLVGNALTNTLTGASGNDKLDGGTGADTLIGANGNDIYIVENSNDVIKEYDTEGIDSVQSSVTYTLSSFVENLTLTGKAAINGTGSDQDNTIIGNAAANTLDGGLSDDTLDGGAGNDTLIGGNGYDKFKFTTALGKNNIDTITDFFHGTDKLQLDDAIFKKFSGDADLSDNFVSGATGVKAVDANDYLIFNTSNGALYYDADGSGNGAMVQFATLTGVSNLSSTDFLVI